MNGPDSPEERIDQLADQFEEDWKAGGRPRVEGYLERAVELGLDRRTVLRELIILECDLWLEAGHNPKLSDYLDQFPDDESVVREAVAFVANRRGEGLPDEVQDEQIPDMIERYAVEKELGSGGFARVFLAHDTELNRSVAIKIPRKKYFKNEEAVRLFLQEAQTLARLNHPSLVTVYTCGRLTGGAVFIVQEFINGPNLGQWARSSSFSHEQIVRLLIEVTEAIAYVHQKKIWHRDLKPANILLDADGRPHVADFGLALHESSRLARRGERSGSPPYMAPEQVNGESHRIDGRTDIWALGVILYELLVRERPFQGAGEHEIFKKIVATDPLPLRQVDRSIPGELERICLKCLRRHRSDRYLSAADLLDDLRHWLEGDGEISEKAQPTPDAEAKPRIIPKGLRSFDAHDADFFLDLLPGPRDRNGLPDSLRFWKTRIEETDPDKTFAVGLIYGPSGCGKSSLVKAGLLPRLDDRVTTVYVEATPQDTEVRLAKGLRRRFPDLPEDLELPEMLWQLRTDARKKLLIVLDQFEQWLHVHGNEQPSQLVEALRQCEAGQIQCVVLVRADFMMAITRFLDSLEAGLVKGANAATADLFAPRHARHVLAAFGRAYSTLPEDPGEMTKVQSQFLDEAVAELAEDERIICVKLALLAELVKGKPWTPATIRDVGGFKGIGRKFLEETFESETAVPKHRFHQKAAEAVLRALLPESDIEEIKGSQQPRTALLKATEYVGREREFDDVLQILDTELRLITPTDPDGLDADEDLPATSESKQRYYQLTHDYLVPSLREWLTRRQKETRRGRAELLLADRAAVWTARQENRQLPSLWQWLQIKALTRKQAWKLPERKMMARAGWVHAFRSGIAMTLMLAITVAGLTLQRRALRKQVQLAVSNLGNTKGVAVPWAIKDLGDFPEDMVVEELGERFRNCEEGQKLSLAYGLAHFGKVDVRFLIAQIPIAESREADNLITAIGKSPEDIPEILREAAASAEKEEDWHEKARLAIVALHLGDSSLAEDMCQFRSDPIRRTIFIDEFPTWYIPAGLPRLAQDIQDAAFRSGMCLAVGSIPPAEVSAEAKDAWQPIVSGWHEKMPDKGTHSSAGWMLRKWELNLPRTAESTSPAEGMEWHRNSIGMTMLHIPAGSFVRRDDLDKEAIEQPVPVPRPFVISDREVSRAQFQRFMDDPKWPDSEKSKDWEGADVECSPTVDHPVQQVSWYDTVLFCNWLSRKELLRESYQIEVTRDGDYEVKVIPNALGYRLPTEAEWEYACRAGTVTAYAIGDDESLLARYAVVFTLGTEICGSKLPNGWGLFDCHGNVCEWCQDWRGQKEGSPVLRGGGFVGSFQDLRSACFHYFLPDFRGMMYGFRVVRAYPDSCQ